MDDGKVIDPVCGMKVDPATSRHRFEHHAQTYHFCGAGCATKFAAAPEQFLKPAPARPAKPDSVHTCPMHPEVRQSGPGSCPICGMALEPLEVSAEAEPNPELADMTRRFWIALALTAPVFALAMAEHVLARAWVAPTVSNWVQCALATPVVVWAGWPFLQRGWASVVSGRLNMFTLIALGTGTAYAYSLVATIAPDRFPAGFRAIGGAVGVYYEAAAVITLLVLLGQVMELRARARTGGALRALLTLAPKTAHRLRPEGDDEEVGVDQVQVGDRLRIRPGDRVPVDGIVQDGSSDVDESMVTGESAGVAKQPDDRLIGGTVNGGGALVMRAEQVGADTVLSRIVGMVAVAQRSRAPIQRLADSVAGLFVPAVLGCAGLAFVAWAVWGPPPAMAYALIAAVSVVIIACPCALGLATPMSIMVGIGKAAAAGVLITSAEVLERMERIDTLVIDKTGTLTAGKPAVVAVVPAGDLAEGEILALAGALERASAHPLAAAILAACRVRGLAVAEAASFTSIDGRGVSGLVGDRRVVLGNARLMADERIALGDLASRAEALRGDGVTAVFVAVDGAACGAIAIADPIKPGTRPALDALRGSGIEIVMLSGDSRTTALAVAGRLGIARVEADMLPEDKLRVVRELRDAGRRVAMAGDGVNDAPALAAAEVGIAMGTGTEIAMETAGVTLVKGDLAGIVRARALSRATMRNIRQNLVFAFGYNAIGIPIAAGVLYPVFGILLSPAVAALAMSLSSVSVILNAQRLRAN